MRRFTPWCVLQTVMLLGLPGCGSSADPAAPAQRPNVIVIFSDDQGWADLGCQGVRQDIKTPHLDALAADGIRCTHGYVTAPQCVPSRAGLLTGRYQQRFGLDDNHKGPLPLSQETIAHRFLEAGYVTGMVGKWHLDLKYLPKKKVMWLTDHQPRHFGFSEFFCGVQTNYSASHDLHGRRFPSAPATVRDERCRVEVQTDAALSFIRRNAAHPFFLYLAYYTPHVPLETPPAYAGRFAHVSDPKRKAALSMMAAMDDGVGKIRQELKQRGVEQNTLIFFISDNGAPIGPNSWNGSINRPMVGQKGMLTEGGIRVPFLACWPGKLPAGKVYDEAVSALDVLPTSLAAAGIAVNPQWHLDGINLLPYLTGAQQGVPHDYLYWKWDSQAALVAGHWKLLWLAPDQWQLYDIRKPKGELEDLSETFPDLTTELRQQLHEWDDTLPTPGFKRKLDREIKVLYDEFW